jgi:hypothetical protein
MDDFEILSAKRSFLRLAEELGKPAKQPLRRTFSLMRSLGCKTIVRETSQWTSDEPCPGTDCDNRRKSCEDYIENLHLYKHTLSQKTCHKLLFFQSKFTDETQFREQKKSDLVGFCIVQTDNFGHARSYVTESIVRDPFGERACTFGDRDYSITVRGVPFSVRGVYFCQQNSLTNCCAHAAIKMAVKGFFPEITAEQINKAVPINHRRRKGNRGLRPDEIQKAIKKITGSSVFLLNASLYESGWDFLEQIYSILETRLPVVLVFSMPGGGRTGRSEGHAVALTGHSFNKHNWWSYALQGYFFQSHEVQYLSSFQWCDNFVVQDDNFGPHYLLPVRFITDVSGANRLLATFQQTFFNLPIGSEENWLTEPLFAIIPYPKGMDYVPDAPIVEPWALRQLELILDGLSISAVSGTESFSSYFYKYYKENQLILRTVLTTKEQYLKSRLVSRDVREILGTWLPDIVWMTEISIPELFWVNRRKVGEIITDPVAFRKDHEDGVRFIRIPEHAFFTMGDDVFITKTKTDRPSHPLCKVVSPFKFR